MKPISRALRAFSPACLILALSTAVVACGSASDNDPSQETETEAALSLALATTTSNVDSAAPGSSGRLLSARLARLFSEPGTRTCDAGTTSFGDCDTEMDLVVSRLLQTPADYFSDDAKSTYSSNFSFIYHNNVMLACAAIVGLENTAELDSATGYPVDGDYTVELTDTTVQAAMVEKCDVPSEIASAIAGMGLSFTTTVASTTDTTLFDKKVTIVVNDEVSTRVEMLAHYSESAIRVFMKQSYKNGCCGDAGTSYNSMDSWYADWSAETGLSRFEYVSPYPSTWSSNAGGQVIRLLIDENSGAPFAKGLVHQWTDSSSGSLAFAGDRDEIAMSMAGTFGGINDSAWTGKAACLDGAGSITEDGTPDCSTLTAVSVASGTSADTLLSGWDALAAGIADIDSTCAAQETSTVTFGSSDFYTADLGFCSIPEQL